MIVDASVAAVAEHFKIETIATINHRDFRVVRQSRRDNFTLVPWPVRVQVALSQMQHT